MVIVVSAIAAGAFIYMRTQTQSLTYNPKISITNAQALQWSGGTLIVVTVANLGSTAVVLKSIDVTGAAEVWSGAQTIEPGQSQSISHNIPRQIPFGEEITVRARAVDSRGMTIEAAEGISVSM